MERYITNESGKRTAVIPPVEEYEALVRIAEDAEDERVVDESLEEMRVLRDRTGGKATRSLDEIEAEIERESESRQG